MDRLNDWITHAVAAWGWGGEALLRLLTAAFLAGLIGVEREVRGRQAGFRTNMLVGLGSALVMIVSLEVAREQWRPAGFIISVDPARIAYSVMTGVGFLGAGAIVKHGLAVRGLTTAAALWCVAAIGLAAGIGLYVIAAAATLVVLVALWLLDYAEKVMPTRRYRRLVVRCAWAPGCVPKLMAKVQEMGLNVREQSFHRVGDLTHVEVEMSIAYTKRASLVRLQETLEEQATCTLISLSRIDA